MKFVQAHVIPFTEGEVVPVSATATKLIRVAPGTIWKTWRKLSQWPQWRPGVTEARWTAGGRWKEGSSFVLHRRALYPLLRRWSRSGSQGYTGQVLSTAEEQLLVWELRPLGGARWGTVLVESVRLEPAPGGTTVTFTQSAHGLIPSLLSPLVGPGLRSEAQNTLEALHYRLAPVEGAR